MAQEKQAPHPAAVAQEFMSRTDMKGKEVQIYAETFNWLQGILEGEIMLVPKEAWTDITEELQAFKDGVAQDPDAELEDVDSEAESIE